MKWNINVFLKLTNIYNLLNVDWLSRLQLFINHIWASICLNDLNVYLSSVINTQIAVNIISLLNFFWTDTRQQTWRDYWKCRCLHTVPLVFRKCGIANSWRSNSHNDGKFLTSYKSIQSPEFVIKTCTYCVLIRGYTRDGVAADWTA